MSYDNLKQVKKRILYLESCEWDCGRFQESLEIMEHAAAKILELGYECTMLDYANGRSVSARNGVPYKSRRGKS
jgi:hypothetical protein